MDAGTILIFGAVLLSMGSLSLLVVRSSNPNLKGLGWMAASFAAGAVGTGLMLVSLPHALSALLPDLLTLLPFVLLQVGMPELMDKRLLPRAGLLLLGSMTVMDALYTVHVVGMDFRITAISLLVATQCWIVAAALGSYRGERGAAWFCTTLLHLFSAYNMVRALLTGTGLARRLSVGRPLQVASFALFILVGMGLAFGFFWLSS